MNELTLFIQSEMRRRGKAQKDLAEFLGIKETGVSNMFARGTYSLSRLKQIAEFLDLPLSSFDSLSTDPHGTEQTEYHQMTMDLLRKLVATQEELLKSKEEIINSLKAHK